MCLVGLLFFGALGSSLPSYALDCKSLDPTTASITEQTFQGKLNGKIDGLFRKFVGADATAEGTYRQIQTDVLKDYPGASRTFIWERFIYLQCQILDSSGESDDRKQRDFLDLITKYENPPIEQAGQSQNCVNSGNDAHCTQTNIGK
jgi:hypothetical protein